MRDWLNKYLVYQPIATVSYLAMVHRTVLPGIGPSLFPHFRTITMIFIYLFLVPHYAWAVAEGRLLPSALTALSQVRG